MKHLIQRNRTRPRRTLFHTQNNLHLEQEMQRGRVCMTENTDERERAAEMPCSLSLLRPRKKRYLLSFLIICNQVPNTGVCSVLSSISTVRILLYFNKRCRIRNDILESAASKSCPAPVARLNLPREVTAHTTRPALGD